MKNKTVSRTIKMLKLHQKGIIGVSFLALLVAVCETIRPYLIKIIIDDYITQGIVQKGSITITMIGIFYIILVVIGNSIDYIATVVASFIGQDTVFTLRNKLYKHTQHNNISFHDKTPAGKMFVRITNDVEDINTLYKDVVTTIAKDSIMIIAFMGMLIYLSPQLSIIAFCILPLVFLSSYFFTRGLRKTEEKSKVIRTKLNTFLAESIYGIKVIKIFNRQREKQRECEEINENLFKTRKFIGLLHGFMQGFMIIFENLAISLIVYACMQHFFGVTMDVGIIYIFTTYLRQIFIPINRILDNMETIQDATVSINKVYEILEQEEYLEDLETGKVLESIKGTIEFKHVWFAYEAENWILKDVSFIIEPGKSIALVGKTGAGKTTIINLINRFYTIQKGEILIDNININEINIHCLRQHIGVVLQDPFLFAKSIKDNIRLNDNISDSAILKALEDSSANEFISRLPKGILEIAKERGSSYSAGQKQLLAFARILAHNPSIFILDEATANIDTHTESLIQKSVDQISKDKTSIFIAHRLSTIINVDKIIVLKEGKIIEQGSHTDLLQTEGYYQKLYQSYYTSLSNI